MNNLLSQAFIFLLFGLITLVSAAGIITLAYYFLLKKYAQLEEETMVKEKELSKQALDTLAEARSEHDKIIAEAKIRADELIREAARIQKNNVVAAIEALNELGNEQAKLLKENFNNILQKHDLKKIKPNEEDIDISNNISKYLEEHREYSLENYKNIFREEAIEQQNALENQIKLEQKAIEEDLGNYKKEQLKKIDDKIINLVSKVVNETTVKVINISEHEDLVLEAFEKAKKEGLLS